jgi:glucokinase
MEGNEGAKAVFVETGRYLGMACANLINLLNLQAIVIGGGVMASADLLLNATREEVRRRAFRASAQDCPIVQSHLWPDAGVIGAAMLARDNS